MERKETAVRATGSVVQDLKQQVEFCLSDTYFALSKTLQKSITKCAPKAMSVPLSVVASALPTTGAKAPEMQAVRTAVEGLQNVEIDEAGILIYRGRSAPNSSRTRECRRKSVVVDKIPADSTAQSVHELLAGCGRIISIGICHPRLAASYVKGAFRSKNVHAIVQFATVQEAVRAVEKMNFSWRGGPRVTHLMVEFRVPSPLRARNQNITREALMSTDSSFSEGSSNDGDESIETLKSQELESESSGELVVSDQPKKQNKNRSRKARAKAESDGNKSQVSKKSDQLSKKHTSRKDYAAWAPAAPENRAQPPRFVNSSSAPGAPVVDGGRPRMPRGPDGTKGFTMGRGRSLPVPT